MMEFVVDERKKEQTAGNERVVTSLARLRKYTFVLPSGRTLKIIQYDENDLERNTA
jgi:hypothetical protein